MCEKEREREQSFFIDWLGKLNRVNVTSDRYQMSSSIIGTISFSDIFCLLLSSIHSLCVYTPVVFNFLNFI